jgi:ATP-binding cassette subfamily B multidrug efflux pump
LTQFEDVKPAWYDRLNTQAGSVRHKVGRLVALVPLLHQLVGPYRKLFYLSGAVTLLVSLIDAAVIVGAVPFITHLFGAAGGSETSIGAWLSGWMPDLRTERGLILGILTLAAGVVVREGVSGLAKTITFFTTGQIVTHIRTQIIENLLGAKTSYIDTLPSGAPLQLVVSETRKVLQGSRAIIGALSHLISCVLLVAVLLSISPVLLAAMIALGILALPLKYLYALTLFRFSQRYLIASITLMDTLTETVRALRQIRIQNRQEEFHRHIETASREVEQMSFRANALEVNEPVFIHVYAIAAMAAVLYGGYSMGVASFAQMSAFFFVLYRLLPPVTALSTQFNSMLAAEPGIVRVAELYLRRSMQRERTGGVTLAKPTVGLIELRNVGLTYADGRAALSGINLKAKQGEFIAIVGESGAGKSSILHVLLGMYDAKGEVLIGGTRIEDVELHSLRERLWLVPQDIHIIRGPVDDFIRGGRLSVSSEVVKAAAGMAAADEFIVGLPDGFKTVIGTGGHLMSGGERQRLALAQAFARDPAVLLLDEATSALDSLTEQKVLDSIAAWRGEKTVILVTHRVTNLQHVDRIYVMKEGRIVESGNWTTLIAREGEFTRLVRRQQGTALVA